MREDKQVNRKHYSEPWKQYKYVCKYRSIASALYLERHDLSSKTRDLRPKLIFGCLLPFLPLRALLK
jgi:hypothetical protein